MADIEELKNISIELLDKRRENYLTLNADMKLILLREEQPSEIIPTFYEPALCLILQGRKEVTAGKRSFSLGAGELLIISHDVPVVSKITDASASEPYVALVLLLDYSIIRSLEYEFAGISQGSDEQSTVRSLEVTEANSHIADSLFRLINASQDLIDSKVLLPQILREVHYRLMQAPSGAMLRNLLQHNSHASKISKAISYIRDNYAETLSVAEVAKSVGMSSSSFFHHFKAITESTPLQYQKDIRLLEARKLLVGEGESVTLTALKVGYESPNQFSREYARKFGAPPSSDLRASATN